ncbi:MAG: DUF2314 domain-containing protein [bacterium]
MNVLQRKHTVTFDMSEESPVTYHHSQDPEIDEASRNARNSFKHFWKEVSLDFNRIIPALGLACVKAPFSDDPSDPSSQVEHMWITEIDYDGEMINGVLMNSPNWLQSVREGDAVKVTVDELSDWMCVLSGKVYGAYTVQATRKRMNHSERKEFDAAWGIEFPPPEDVLLPPSPSPFEPVLARQLEVELGRNTRLLTHKYDDGRTLLHLDALCGRSLSVKVLLQAGADRSAKCDRGWTPVDYAKAAGWEEIVAQLTQN